MSLWYYEHDGAQQGPVDAETLKRLVDEGVVSRETLVWRDGMADWMPAAQAPSLMGGAPPPGFMPAADRAFSTPPGAGEAYAPVDNHLVKAILSTLFCCMPLGIVAIVYASQVSGKLQRGFYDDAVASAEKANQWANFSIIAGFVVGVLYVLFVLGFGVLRQ